MSEPRRRHGGKPSSLIMGSVRRTYGFVGRLLHEDAIELDACERLQDVVDSLKPATRKYMDRQLTGSETARKL